MLNSLKGALYAHRITIFMAITILGGFIIGFQENSWFMAKKIFHVVWITALIITYVGLPVTAALSVMYAYKDKEWGLFRLCMFYLISFVASFPLQKIIFTVPYEGPINIEILGLAIIILSLAGAFTLSWLYDKIETL